MSEKKIKPDKSNLLIKEDSNSMNIDDDYDDKIFDENGNLDSDQNEINSSNMLIDDEDDDEINDKDSWKVIRAYFKQHGLVSQQIGSFNQFVGRNIQEIIDENKLISIEPDMNYYKNASQISYELTFGQAHIADHPQFLESNSSTEHIIYPNEARVRNLDYISDLSVDIQFKEKVYNRDEGTYDTISTHDIPKQNIGKICTS